ncbi:MAG: hypothetical protein ABEJ28_05700 [Salinigranum sp.]
MSLQYAVDAAAVTAGLLAVAVSTYLALQSLLARLAAGWPVHANAPTLSSGAVGLLALFCVGAFVACLGLFDGVAGGPGAGRSD